MRSRAGAVLTCRTMGGIAVRFCNEDRGLPDDDLLADWIDRVRERIYASARFEGAEPRDYACTLVACIVRADAMVTVHVGDGAVVTRDVDGAWECPSWPETGEYASTTYFVTEDPVPRVRTTRRSDGAPVEIAVLTDGIERLALDYASRMPHAPFFDGLFGIVRRSEAMGRDVRLSSGLADFLGGPKFAERTDDDKTLILASRAR